MSGVCIEKNSHVTDAGLSAGGKGSNTTPEKVQILARLLIR